MQNFVFLQKNNMYKAERQELILSLLEQKGKINTIDIALTLKTSVDSIRRDFEELQSKGLLKKVYGGALNIPNKNTSIFDISINNEDKKIKIAQKAIGLLQNNQTILMSGGTTNFIFSKMIPTELKATIYTFSLPIAMQLFKHKNIDLFFMGGKIQKNAMVTTGIDVIQSLSKIKADICFMGTSSININNGLTELGYEVSLIKTKMIEISNTVVSMVTSEKIDTKNTHHVSDIKNISTIITEISPYHKKFEKYKQIGVKVI